MRVDKSHGIIILFVALLFFRNFFREIQVKKTQLTLALRGGVFSIFYAYIHTFIKNDFTSKGIFFPFILNVAL